MSLLHASKKSCIFKSKSSRINLVVKYAGSALVIIFVSAPAISSFARSSHHSSSSGGDFGKILALGAALLVGLVFAAINATKMPKRVSQEKANQMAAAAT